jgi:hypothetical protein
MATPVVVTRIQNRRGTQAQFDALYPPGYTGIGGFGSLPGFTLANFPGVLVSGELALVTDTRRMFMGNINGEYIELDSATSLNSIDLLPIVITLPPAAVFTVIPSLTYAATPFTKILYDITDSVNPDWNIVGTDFSRNGQLEITAVDYFLPVWPNEPVTLTDTGTEINLVSPNQISFIAQYDLTQTLIEILYMHDFAGSLTFSSASIKWLPF